MRALRPMTDYSKWERINASIEDDEEDHARARLRMQKEEMTEQEVRRIHECWEKPEFRAMFDEYAQEVCQHMHMARKHSLRTPPFPRSSSRVCALPAGLGRCLHQRATQRPLCRFFCVSGVGPEAQG